MALLLGWKDHAAPMFSGAREQFQEKREPVFRAELREDKQMDRCRDLKRIAAGRRPAGEPEEAGPTSEKREQAMGASHLLHDRTTRLVRTRTEGNGRTGSPAFNAVAQVKASRSGCMKKRPEAVSQRQKACRLQQCAVTVRSAAVARRIDPEGAGG
jgi:hypothetical protein